MRYKRMKRTTALVMAFLMTLLCLGAARPVQAGAAVTSIQTLEKISAYYSGGAVEVGKSIDTSKLHVTAYYKVHDGYSTTTKIEQVKTGYTLSPATVTKKGDNTITVMLEDKTTTFTVEGKTVVSITADYVGGDVTIGESFSKKLVEVEAFFSDGSRQEVTDFQIYSTVVRKEGFNTFPVYYGDQVSFIYVNGKEALAVKELLVSYDGDPIIVGNTVNKSDLDVWALYNNGDFVQLKNFNVSPSVISEEGKNIVQVSFGGQTAQVEIWGLKKEIEEISVRYKGAGVVVGTTVNKDDIEVIATYNDGTTGETDAFTLANVLISEIGDNVVTVFCDEFVEYIIVNGVEGFAPNFDNSLIQYVFGKTYRQLTYVTLGMPAGLPRDSFRIERLDDVIARRVVYRVAPTDDYIAFTIAYDDDEMVTKFPMAVRVTLPKGFDPEKFGVYYTPNQSTIMAKLDGAFIDEEKTSYQFIVYQPGAYVLMNKVSNLQVQEIIVEEKLELKTNRNYSLKPVVLPKIAEKKDVTFRSTDETIATVSETGKIKTLRTGTCEIWVEATDGSGVTAVVTLKVIDPKKK